MYRIVMLPLAERDLENIILYLSQFYESTALKQYDRIAEKIRLLAEFPEMCEVYEQGKYRFTYRKLVSEEYLVFYAVMGDEVQIHRILHSSRDIKQYL